MPETLTFATKPELARRMLKYALENGVPARWLTADSLYGGDGRLRQDCLEHQLSYVLGVRSTQNVLAWHNGVAYAVSIGEVVQNLKADAWEQLSAGEGAKGPRVYEWAGGQIRPSAAQPGWMEWGLARRSLSDPTDLAYYLACAPVPTTQQQLVAVATTRWAVEESLETAKGEVGLDQYEVRRWTGWYRHITLAWLAQAFLTVTRAQAVGSDGQNGGSWNEM